MRKEDYAEIKDAVEKAGFFTAFEPCGEDEDACWSIVLVSRCTDGRLHGNSFSLFLDEQGLWYLTTWTPVAYLIPAGAELTALCLECLRASGVPLHVVRPDIASRYGLVELPPEESDAG